MEVMIRLQKAGKTANKRYNYRIVATSKNSSRESRHLEILGHYDPSQKPAVISINKEKVNQWLAKGAILSDTVKSLLGKVKT